MRGLGFAQQGEVSDRSKGKVVAEEPHKLVDPRLNYILVRDKSLSGLGMLKFPEGTTARSPPEG